jgi:hypothetical protein
MEMRQSISYSDIAFALFMALVLGAGIGALTAFEPQFALESGFVYFLRSFGAYYIWPLTVIALMCLGALTLLALNAEFLFVHRRRVLLGLVIAAPCFSGVNAGPIDPSDPIFLLAFLFVLGFLMLDGLPVQFDPMVIALLGLVVIFSFTSIMAGRMTTMVSMHTIITKVLLLFIVANLIRSYSDLHFALKVFLAVAAFSAVVALVSQAVFIATGYPFTFDDSEAFHYKNTPFGRMMRATAFLSSTQGLAHIMVVGAAIAAAAPMSLMMRAAIVGLLGLGCLATFSTGSYLAVAVVIVVTPFVLMPRQAIPLIAVYLGGFAVMFFTGLLNVLLNDILIPLGLQNFLERMEFIRRGTRGLELWTWTGNGINNMSRHLETAIHNAYVQGATDIGVIGGLAFTAMIVYLAVSIGLVRRQMTGDARAYANGLFIAMIGIIVHLMVEPFYNNTSTWLIFGIVTAALIVTRKTSNRRSMIR